MQHGVRARGMASPIEDEHHQVPGESRRIAALPEGMASQVGPIRLHSIQTQAGCSAGWHDDVDVTSVSINDLYRRLQRHVPGVATSLLGGTSAPTDLVHDAVTDIVLSLPRFRHGCEFRSWVRAIVRRHVQRWIRSQQRHRRLLRAASEEAKAAPAVRADESIDLKQALGRLDALLLGLPKRQLVCLFSTEVEGLSSEVVAKQLGITPAAVRTNSCRARAYLRKSLTGH